MTSEDTAVPFPYPRSIVGTRHCRILISGNINSYATGINIPNSHPRDTALLYPDLYPRLIVGTRHCRVLTLGNINSEATGFEIAIIIGDYLERIFPMPNAQCPMPNSHNYFISSIRTFKPFCASICANSSAFSISRKAPAWITDRPLAKVRKASGTKDCIFSLVS